MARFYTFFDQLLLFLACTGVKMHTVKQKNNICMLVVQNIGYFCKKLELLEWQRWNFSHMQMKSRPEKDQKMIFLSVEQFIVKMQFEISKYLISILMSSNICGGRFGRSVQLVPKTLEVWGEKSKKKAWLYVKFCISYQLVLQICKESETEPKF